MTTLILRSDHGAVQIINLLLNCILVEKVRGSEEMKSDIIEKSKEILRM